MFSRVRKYEEQPEFKNAITEMKKKNALEEIKSGINEQEEWISKMEDIVVEITDAEKNKQKGIKTKKINFKDFWDKVKRNNNHIYSGPGKEEGEKCPGKILKIIAEKFLNTGKEIVTHV